MQCNIHKWIGINMYHSLLSIWLLFVFVPPAFRMHIVLFSLSVCVCLFARCSIIFHLAHVCKWERSLISSRMLEHAVIWAYAVDAAAAVLCLCAMPSSETFLCMSESISIKQQRQRTQVIRFAFSSSPRLFFYFTLMFVSLAVSVILFSFLWTARFDLRARILCVCHSGKGW